MVGLFVITSKDQPWNLRQKRYREVKRDNVKRYLRHRQLFSEYSFGSLWCEFTGQPLTPQSTLNISAWPEDVKHLKDVSVNRNKLMSAKEYTWKRTNMEELFL